MRPEIIVTAVVFVLFIIAITVASTILARSDMRKRRMKDAPARSLCCGRICDPLGWTADGWVAICRGCGAWQFLGDDHANPPSGFRRDGRPERGLLAGGKVLGFENVAADRERMLDQTERDFYRHEGERMGFRWPTQDEAHAARAHRHPDMPEVTSDLWPAARHLDMNDEGEPLELPPQPNIGGEGNPDYQGGHYESVHEQGTRFVPYDMLRDPPEGAAVIPVKPSFGIVGPLRPKDSLDDGD